MQIIILALMVFTTSMYAWLHNVPSFFSPLHMGIENYYEAAANFNFIGVNPENPQPTIYAVMLETLRACKRITSCFSGGFPGVNGA
jgi:hypothetical protein